MSTRGTVMSAEAIRYGEAVGEAPEPASVFGNTYLLPSHSYKALQGKFAHPLDKDLLFYEKPHVYTYRGRCTTASVSGLIKPYCEEFNANVIISRMRASKREAWPRLKYAYKTELVEEPKTLTPDTLVLVVNESGLTTYAGPVDTIPHRVAQDSLYTYERSLTDPEIAALWSDPEARNRGTEAHYQVERFLNSLPTHANFPELNLAKRFMCDELVPIGAKAFRTEWESVATEEDVAGSIDAVFVLNSGKLIICDWKRSEKLSANVHSVYGKRLRHPFEHIEGTSRESTHSWYDPRDTNPHPPPQIAT